MSQKRYGLAYCDLSTVGKKFRSEFCTTFLLKLSLRTQIFPISKDETVHSIVEKITMVTENVVSFAALGPQSRIVRPVFPGRVRAGIYEFVCMDCKGEHGKGRVWLLCKTEMKPFWRELFSDDMQWQFDWQPRLHFCLRQLF